MAQKLKYICFWNNATILYGNNCHAIHNLSYFIEVNAQLWFSSQLKAYTYLHVTRVQSLQQSTKGKHGKSIKNTALIRVPCFKAIMYFRICKIYYHVHVYKFFLSNIRITLYARYNIYLYIYIYIYTCVHFSEINTYIHSSEIPVRLHLSN